VARGFIPVGSRSGPLSLRHQSKANCPPHGVRSGTMKVFLEGAAARPNGDKSPRHGIQMSQIPLATESQFHRSPWPQNPNFTDPPGHRIPVSQIPLATESQFHRSPGHRIPISQIPLATDSQFHRSPWPQIPNFADPLATESLATVPLAKPALAGTPPINLESPEKWGNGWGISPYLSSRSDNRLITNKIIYGMQIAQSDLSRIAPNEHLQRGP